jgi:hypothetical protein
MKFEDVDPQDFKARCKVVRVGQSFYCLGVEVKRTGQDKWMTGNRQGNWKEIFNELKTRS